MRIGLVTSSWGDAGSGGGISKNYRRLASALAARGHEVTVFHINRNRSCWQRRLCRQEDGFTVAELPCRVLPSGWKIRGRSAIARLVAQVRLCWNIRWQSPRLDVVEATSSQGDAWLYCHLHWRRQPPILVRFSTIGTQVSEFKGDAGKWSVPNVFPIWLENSLIRSARHLCTHTLAHRDEVCAFLAVDPNRVLIIPHGVAAAPAPRSEKAEAGLDRMVLYVGRFEARKGTDCLLAAIPKVLASWPECRFVLAGGVGQAAERSQEEFRRRHGSLIDKVRFIGVVTEEELDALYRRCDFFVSPALYESFGMTYVEAMRHGRPVIGCQGSGSAEVIGDAGLIVAPNDADELAQAIICLWTDRQLHRELAARALLRAEHFSMEKKIERTERAYEELVRLR